MSQFAKMVPGQPDYARAVAPTGPFLRAFRNAREETEMDSCMRALDRLRCPEKSRDALLAYSSKKFPREKDRVGFLKEAISAAERVAGFKPGEAYRKRGTLERLLGDSARYEEDWYESGEKYLALLDSDDGIARFTDKRLLEFLKDTNESRGVIGTYVDRLYYCHRKGPAWTVAHMTHPGLFSAAEPLKALCNTGTEAV